jgi:hypothetical protein
VPSTLAGGTIVVQAAQLSTFLPNDSLFGIPRMVTFNDGNL